MMHHWAFFFKLGSLVKQKPALSATAFIFLHFSFPLNLVEWQCPGADQNYHPDSPQIWRASKQTDGGLNIFILKTVKKANVAVA